MNFDSAETKEIGRQLDTDRRSRPPAGFVVIIPRDIIPVVNMFELQTGIYAQTELEAKLKMSVPLTEIEYKTLLKRLDSLSVHWTYQDTTPQPSIDYYTLDNIRVQKKVDSVGAEVLVFQKKKRLQTLDLLLSESTEESKVLATVRLSLANEDRVNPVDYLQNTSFVRMKRRVSFIYKRMIRYDFTNCWQGRTVKDAKAAGSFFEIELEMLDLVDILKLYGKQYVIVTLLEKMRHLVTLITDIRKQRTLQPPLYHLS